MNAAAPNHFLQFWQAGYRRIVPVIPAGARAPAELTPGKTPGELNGDGTWHGLPGWQHLHPTETDMVRWHHMGANVGLRCGDGTGLLGIDADTLDAATAATIKEKITAALGPLPERIGQAPKALFLCRVDPEYEHPTIDFDSGHIEVRTYSQFVAAGTHAKTLKPYEWPVRPLPYEKLPLIDSERLNSLWVEIRDALPGGVFTSDPEGKAIPGNQDGDPALIKRAVEAIPNDYSDRRIYIKMAAWLKSNHPDTEAAFLLFKEWCDDWPQGNDEAIVTKDWNSLTAPYRVGKNWGYRTATLRSPDTCPLFWYVPETVAAAPSTGLERVNAASLAGKPIPIQQWLVRDMIPAVNVTSLGGDGGTGKSLLALHLAVAKATGGEWMGHMLERGRVLYLSAEDEIDELHRRMNSMCADLSLLVDLDIVPLAGKDAVLAAPDGKDGGLLRATKLFGDLRATLSTFRPALLVLDTLADLFGGDEIKKIHARAFIGMLRGLALDFELTVLLLFHPSIAGMTSGSGTSGNVAWGNSVRSRLSLERQKDAQGKEIDSNFRMLEVKKANRASAGQMIPLRYAGGKFVREGGPAVASDAIAEAERLFMFLLDQFERENRPVSDKPNVGNYAPKMFSEHHAANRMGKSNFARAMNRLFEQSVIEIATYGRDHKKIARKMQPEVANNDLFG